MSDLRPAVFLDRDGTLIVERHYLADPDGVELVPGAVEALRLLREAGYALVVVTNQSGIARGLYSEADYARVASRLDELLGEHGVPVDGTYFCPHHPEVSPACDCRKPDTGMYLRASRELGVATAGSWYVGDKVSDLLPALTLSGRGILVRTGYGREEEPRLSGGAVAVDDLSAAAEHIRRAPRLDPR